MTAYQPFPTGAQERDPTAVMGRRTLAWFVDLLLFVAFSSALFAVFAEYVEVPHDLVVDACEVLREEAGDEAASCMVIDDRAYITSASEAGVQTLASLGYLVFFIVLQGLAGASPGKFLTGLRVVDASGNRAGVGKSFGRTALWIIDGAPWFAPLVGFFVGLTSTGHRRVGDMAAGTYVVRSSDVGRPVDPKGYDPSGGGWGTSGPTWSGTAPPPPGHRIPTTPPVADAPPAAGAPPVTPPVVTTEPSISGVPAQTPAPPPIAGGPSDDHGPSSTPPPGAPPTPESEGPQAEAARPVDESPPEIGADPDWWRGPDLTVQPPPELRDEPPTEPEPIEWQPPSATEEAERWEPPASPSAREPRPFTAPGADAVPTGPDTTPPQPAPAPPPQWDPARNTYIQWDPNQQAWLQWDTAAERWKPIDT